MTAEKIFKWTDPKMWSKVFQDCLLKAGQLREEGKTEEANRKHHLAAIALQNKTEALNRIKEEKKRRRRKK